MESGRNAASVTPDPQPVIQQQIDYARDLSRRLGKSLEAIDQRLDNLTNRPPRAVEDAMGPVSGDVARPSIEGAFNQHNAYMEGLCKDADALLARLRRAI